MRILILISFMVGWRGGHCQEVQCNKYHISSALQSSANCQPRDKIIRLDPPGNMTVDTMTPNYIQVQRCGGACPSTSQSCVPTKQRQRNVSIIVGRCGVESGICSKECYSLTVDEDLECSCDCLQAQRECGPGKLFMSDSCSCRCEDLEAAKRCKDEDRVWDTKSCTCGCPARTLVECSPGMMFDNETCTCTEPIYSILTQVKPVDQPESRVSRSNFTAGDHEVVVIVLLSAVLVVSLFVSVLLMRHVYVLRSRLKAVLQENSDRKGCLDSYVACSNPSPPESAAGASGSSSRDLLKLRQSDSTTPLLVDMRSPTVVGVDCGGFDELPSPHNAHIMPPSAAAGVNRFDNRNHHHRFFGNQQHQHQQHHHPHHLHHQQQFSKLADLQEESLDNDISDSIDSSISKGESGFESVTVSENDKIYGIDSLSIINSRLHTASPSSPSQVAGSNPSIFSRSSVETSV